jgi:hypothetical protein
MLWQMLSAAILVRIIYPCDTLSSPLFPIYSEQLISVLLGLGNRYLSVVLVRVRCSLLYRHLRSFILSLTNFRASQ